MPPKRPPAGGGRQSRSASSASGGGSSSDDDGSGDDGSSSSSGSGSSSSGSSSVGQQELGCSHSAEAKTHCPGNSPDKKRVITYRDTLKVCFNDSCKYPDSFWAVRSRHIVDWLDICILYWLSRRIIRRPQPKFAQRTQCQPATEVFGSLSWSNQCTLGAKQSRLKAGSQADKQPAEMEKRSKSYYYWEHVAARVHCWLSAE